MVERMMAWKRTGARAAGLVVLFLASLSALAEPLPDPTRPPPGWAESAPDMAATVSGPILQSVQISAAGRTAIINGQLVRVGQKIGDARVIRISEDEVVLKGGTGMETLSLFPGVQKKPVFAETRADGKRRPARNNRSVP
jgi:MSHA biogenesis protein MshK